MKDRLVQYVNQLFAGTPGNDDIRQEILQNTLDRYDDLIAQGKSPEAAYQLAISGIGDINEIFSNSKEAPNHLEEDPSEEEPSEEVTPGQKLRNAVSSVSGILVVIVYLLISFYTHAWGITWVIFPIYACLSGLIGAIIDYKEAKNYES